VRHSASGYVSRKRVGTKNRGEEPFRRQRRRTSRRTRSDAAKRTLDPMLSRSFNRFAIVPHRARARGRYSRLDPGVPAHASTSRDPWRGKFERRRSAEGFQILKQSYRGRRFDLPFRMALCFIRHSGEFVPIDVHASTSNTPYQPPPIRTTNCSMIGNTAMCQTY
jgi:hypothetical protein